MGYFNFLVSISITTFVFGIFALGLNLKWGFSGLLDFGHVAFLSLGAYTTVILSLKGIPLFFCVLAGVFIAGLFGALLGFPALRLRDDYLAIVTLSFAQILNLILMNEEWLTGGTVGLHGFSRPLEGSFAALDYNYFLLILVLVLIVVVYFVVERLINSPWGRILKSIREDDNVTLVMGKNVFSYKIQALALGSAIAGLAGALYVFRFQYINPHMFAPMVTFNAWIAVVLGGSANNRGTILGTVLIWGVLLNGTRLLTDYIPLGSSQVAALRIMSIGLILMILMRFKPEGVLGNKEELAL